MNERRRFTRIFYNNLIVIKNAAGEECVAKVENISLKGGFITIQDNKVFTPGEPLDVTMVLAGDAESTITARARVMWKNGTNGYGLQLESMEADSFVQLRRLMELNVPDAAVLKRDIAHLVQSR